MRIRYLFCFEICLCVFVCLFVWSNSSQWARASSLTRFIDHTQQSTTLDRTPVYVWSTRRRDFYLTTHNTHDIHAAGGIRTHNLSKRAAADLCLRPRGHWDLLFWDLRFSKQYQDYARFILNAVWFGIQFTELRGVTCQLDNIFCTTNFLRHAREYSWVSCEVGVTWGPMNPK